MLKYIKVRCIFNY